MKQQCDYCDNTYVVFEISKHMNRKSKDNTIYIHNMEDPFMAEIFDEHDLYWICESCHEDRVNEI